MGEGIYVKIYYSFCSKKGVSFCMSRRFAEKLQQRKKIDSFRRFFYYLNVSLVITSII